MINDIYNKKRPLLSGLFYFLCYDTKLEFSARIMLWKIFLSAWYSSVYYRITSLLLKEHSIPE